MVGRIPVCEQTGQHHVEALFAQPRECVFRDARLPLEGRPVGADEHARDHVRFAAVLVRERDAQRRAIELSRDAVPVLGRSARSTPVVRVGAPTDLARLRLVPGAVHAPDVVVRADENECVERVVHLPLVGRVRVAATVGGRHSEHRLPGPTKRAQYGQNRLGANVPAGIEHPASSAYAAAVSTTTGTPLGRDHATQGARSSRATRRLCVSVRPPRRAK